MNIRTSLGPYEQQVLVNNTFIPGVESFDGTYETSQIPINAVGKGYTQSLIDQPPRGAFSMTRNMLYVDPLINFTGEDPMKIRVVYPNANNVGDASLDIKDAYMSNYSVSCSVGSLPQINNSFDVYGDMGSTIFFNDNYIDPNFINNQVWERNSVTLNPDSNGFPIKSPRGINEATSLLFGNDGSGKGRLKASIDNMAMHETFMLTCQAKLIDAPANSTLSIYITESDENSKGRKDIDVSKFNKDEWTKINIKLTRDTPLPTVGNIDLNIESDAGVKIALFNFNFVKVEEIEFNQEDSIPNDGSIHITCEGSETNSVKSFEYSINVNRKPFFVVGDLEPKIVETIYPMTIDARFTMELNDYEAQNMKDVFATKKLRDIDIVIKNRYNTFNGESEFPHITDTMSKTDNRPINAWQGNAIKLQNVTGETVNQNYSDAHPSAQTKSLITPPPPVKGFSVWKIHRIKNHVWQTAAKGSDPSAAVGITGRKIEDYYGFGRDYTFSTYVWIPGNIGAEQISNIFAVQYDDDAISHAPGPVHSTDSQLSGSREVQERGDSHLNHIILGLASGSTIDITDADSVQPASATEIGNWQRVSASFRPDMSLSATHPHFAVILAISLPHDSPDSSGNPSGIESHTYLSCTQIENLDKPTPFKTEGFFTLPVKNAHLVSESFGGDSQDGSVVNLTYRGYINQPGSECAPPAPLPFAEIDWPKPGVPNASFSFYAVPSTSSLGGERFCVTNFGNFNGTYIEGTAVWNGRPIFMKEDGSAVMYYGQGTPANTLDGGHHADAYGSYPSDFEHAWFISFYVPGQEIGSQSSNRQVGVDNTGSRTPSSSIWEDVVVNIGEC